MGLLGLLHQKRNLLLTYLQSERLILQKPSLFFICSIVGVIEIQKEEALVVRRARTIAQV